ncbi:adenylyltransferase/cytidyltransferase family protein [Thetidibacter halocola]|uniref:Adenylyltransferase/cytidyltransferase family protein n=1 Tax=Thetidibacter halocola TaxID=2827239 RepID=A0A8J7WBP1_9RHOB|nr:adenylyltransferase/cytidyltransferase family protein [Thetidibacter halocola]MBS0124580.1 adenylyltransferase/cytidyltransferase family protein [Thetidibacter halocola]
MLTVFTEGVFDLLPMNHMRLLHEARAMGDRLLVGVTPDDDTASYKRRPILTLEERMETVRATGIAAHVLPLPHRPGITAELLDEHAIGLVV